jgi:phosphatidate cytidylyltransferase
VNRLNVQTPETGARPLRDLKTRLISGVLLAAAAIGLTWASPWTFALLVLAVSIIVAWEWGRIVRDGGIDMIFVVHASALCAAVALGVVGQPVLGLIALLVGTIVTALLGFGDRGPMTAVGLIYAGLPAVALVWLRGARPYGFEAALFLLLSVWATDTGAYAAGRLIGGPKLAPAVSPNKTWSGLLGGVTASALVALVLALAINAGPARLVLTAVFLAVISQAGDLMESALKRQHAVKDASNIIPGHGGFMDRVDGLIFASVAAAVLAAMVDVSRPASALLGFP